MEAASQAVLQLFEVRSTRVTLKVDLPQEHHFFVIGRKGENMKQVMSLTGCHIHFPDSGRAGAAGGKGGAAGGGAAAAAAGGNSFLRNQVIITGAPDGVEEARRQIRGLLPIVISFDVPPQVAADQVVMTPELRSIGEQYNVTVFFKKRRDRGPLALVKGTRHRSSVVFEAAQKILQHWTGSADLPEFTLQIDMSCAQHALLLGKGGANIKNLMAITGTLVRFPAAHTDSAVFIR